MKNTTQAAGVANKPVTTNPSSPAAAPTALKTTKPDAGQIRALTEKLAYELWEKHGKKSGNELNDWLEAEKLARKNLGG